MGKREASMRIATIILSVLGAAGWLLVARYTFFSGSDPAMMGLDTIAGWAVTILFLVTSAPAFVLALTKRWPKCALALALAYPAGFAALFVAVMIYFDLI